MSNINNKKVGVDIIGLSRKCVKLIPYDSCWKEEYIKEEKVLRSIMGEYLFNIQHVGSTSIESLDSKPIIDSAVGVESLSIVDNFRSLLESVGYEYRDNEIIFYNNHISLMIKPQ